MISINQFHPKLYQRQCQTFSGSYKSIKNSYKDVDCAKAAGQQGGATICTIFLPQDKYRRGVNGLYSVSQ